jgi:hypothetical protein
MGRASQGSVGFASSPRPDYILKLPNEVLLEIIKLATPPDIRPPRSTAAKTCERCFHQQNAMGIKALSLVCRRFRNLSQPFLFHSIGIVLSNTLGNRCKSQPMVDIGLRTAESIDMYGHRVRDYKKRAGLLARLPKLRTPLGNCKILCVYFQEGATESCRPEEFSAFAVPVLRDLDTWLTSVRCVKNGPGYGGVKYDCGRFFKQIPSISKRTEQLICWGIGKSN